MVSLAGASAAYGGYQNARLQDNQIQSGDITNQNALIDQQGTEALGRAIAAFQAQVPGAQPMPGAGPQGPMPNGGHMGQPPMPGQPSVPRQSVASPPQMQSPGFQPGPTNAAPQMQSPGFQPPGGQPQGQPAAMGAMPGGGAGGIEALRGKLDVQTLMGAIAKANPGASPAVLASAVTKALPLLTAQAQMDWKQMSLAMAGGRLENAREGTAIRQQEADRKQEQGDVRLQQGERRVTNLEADTGSKIERRGAQTQQGAQRIEQAGAKEARLAAAVAVRQDQGWQRLEQQKEALAQRITQAGDRSKISEWRAIVDAQHKRAMEIIQANSINSGLTPADKKALISEQNKFYDEQIKQMRGGQGNSTGRPAVTDTTGQPAAPKVEERVPQGATTPAMGAKPRAKNPTTGEEVEYDGTGWVPVGAPGKQGAMETGDIEVSSRRRGLKTNDPFMGGEPASSFRVAQDAIKFAEKNGIPENQPFEFGGETWVHGGGAIDRASEQQIIESSNKRLRRPVGDSDAVPRRR
jgi:hypothetical protein